MKKVIYCKKLQNCLTFFAKYDINGERFSFVAPYRKPKN